MSNFLRVHCSQVSDSGPHGPLVFQEQDKSSDVEKPLHFGDRKYSNTLPQMRGRGLVGWFTKPTGTSYNFDKV